MPQLLFFFNLGLAGGITLLSLARGFGVNLESLLFGSILIVNMDQIITAAVVAAISLSIIFLFFKEMVYITFDETQARAAGIKTWVFDYLLSILAGVVVIIAIPIVGVLLISALLVLPALISTQVTKSFKQTVILCSDNWSNHCNIRYIGISHFGRSAWRNNCSSWFSDSCNSFCGKKNPRPCNKILEEIS